MTEDFLNLITFLKQPLISGINSMHLHTFSEIEYVMGLNSQLVFLVQVYDSTRYFHLETCGPEVVVLHVLLFKFETCNSLRT